VADATVRGGVNAAVNYGTNATLDLRLDGSADNLRRAHLRWSLAGLSGRVLHARLRLTPVSVGTNGLEHAVALADSSDWLENAVNWNTQPVAGKRFATQIPANNAPVEFVVTPQVQAALADDGRLALQIASLKNAGVPGLVSYASREDPDPARRPQLLLMFSNAVPNVSAIGDQFIPVNTNTGPLPFTVSDPVHAANLLNVGASSANPALVPDAALVLGGSLSNRTLTVTPLPGQTGSALILVTVTNPLGQTAGTQFLLQVTTNAANTNPASGNWALDASGAWGDPLNWTGGIIATGASMSATFGVDATASRFINNETARTLGHLLFTDANPVTPAGWFITNQPLTLQTSNGTPTITVSDVEATLHAALGGTQGWTKQGDGTLILAGTNSYTGVTTISAGTVRAAHDSALGSAAAGTTIQNPETARLELTGGITLAEPLTVSCKGAALGNAPAVVNVSGTNTLGGQINLTTGGSFWTFEAAGGKLQVAGAATNSTTANVRTIWLRGAAAGEWSSAIGDSAGGFATALRKDDSGLWTLSGTNTSTGSVTASNGTLNVSGIVRGPVNVFGGTLGGTGQLSAPVSLAAGATLAPGTEPGNLGTLTLNHQLTLASGSVTVMELNALNLTCDRVVGLSNLVFGGTLMLSNVAGTLLAGQGFPLFQATNTSGSFASLSPPSPGPGLAWDFNPTNGTLSVLSVAPPQFTSVGIGGGSFTASGTGPVNAPYRILASTNLALPLAAWMPLSTGTFVGGVFSFADTQSSNSPVRFYRVAVP
jgi:autotransporter-associated beta strand protein